MTIILVIILFGLMIVVHELGHFITAKLSGVKVEQFTIGFGPAIFKKEYKGTLYAIRALPIGGAVMMKGESGEEEVLVGNAPKIDDDKEGSFLYASPLKKILICFAGSFMNFLSGVLILLILFLPVKMAYSPVITGFIDGFSYNSEEAFQKGDRLIKINGFRIYTYNDVANALSLGEGRPFDFTVRRDGEKIRLKNLPIERTLFDENDPDDLKYGFIFGVESLDFGGRLSYALRNAASFVQSAYKSFGMLITGKLKGSDVMGTVGIASEMNKRAKASAAELWYFVSFISINLAVVNLLPIPAIDGGKILIILIETLVGKKLDPKIEGIISLIGLIGVLALFVFVTYNDIVRILS